MRWANEANQGFTLIELIIYLAIVSVLATSLILWSLTVGDLGARARQGAELNSSGRLALEIITRDLELAAAVTVPADSAPSPVLTLVNTLGEMITIRVSGGQLTRIVAGGNPLPLTAPLITVTDFSATRVAGPWAARPTLAVTLVLRALPAPARAFTTVINLRR